MYLVAGLCQHRSQVRDQVESFDWTTRRVASPRACPCRICVLGCSYNRDTEISFLDSLRELFDAS